MKEKKMKILGMGNSNNLNYLIIKKENGFFEWLNKLLVGSFGAISPDVMYYENIKKNEEVVSVKKNVLEVVDIHEYYDTDAGVRIDIFYGANKIFLTFNSSLDKRKRFMDVLEKISEFIEHKGDK